ncbi:MAG TPA: Ada metal-binding domain-containing protein, partial [Vicinamibacteria bacterium]|nr:Ada metal-binding domain-containing protein [Vicinamibacteria bacterium]
MLMARRAPGKEADTVEDAARWTAVLARDEKVDGQFVFAVATTGVYCRPSCPARRPLRRNARFFDTPEAAEQAGFRACRRCRPREGGKGRAAAELLRAACRLLDQDRAEPWKLAGLAEAVGASPRRLLRAFKEGLGVTPRQYAQARRLAAFKGKLRKGDTVTEALYDVGFGSSSRLYEDVQGRLGMTPAIYRRGGAGLSIAYTLADSDLGRILVAATTRGVAAVLLGDSSAALESSLRAEYPAAELRRDDAALARWVGAVLDQLTGRAPHGNL